MPEPSTMSLPSLNLLTDIAGLAVGHADDARLASGVTAIVFDAPAIASVSVLGGAPGTRETELLAPESTVPAIDAILLSGGSAFGLDAGGGAQAWLRENGRGLQVGTVRVPLVPQAICFDLLNGGDKNWGRFSPYRDLGYEACRAAKPGAFALGTVGGGYGATTVNLKGGLGSASARTRGGHTVAALVIVNALGSAVIGDGPHFWAAGLERDAEFGGLGFPVPLPAKAQQLRWKGQAHASSVHATTIALVATDAVLDKPLAKRLAVAAHAGMARALRLSHAAMDGDTVFAAATGRRPLAGPDDLTEITATAADCLSRAIARGIHSATALPFAGALPAWRDRFGGA
jgi:L-aminopeptidase/D-esterase-like protein